MSLSFDLTNVKDYEEVCFEETENGREQRAVTQALIFHAMGAGIGEITEETANEFYARVNAREKLHGPMVHTPDDEDPTGWSPYFITREDVEAHIGLTTNVYPREARASWALRLIEDAYRLPRETAGDEEGDEHDY